VTGKTAHNYLNGKTKIDVEIIPLIAKALRVDINELFESKNQSEKKSYFTHLEDPESKYKTCPECLEKQKKLDEMYDQLQETEKEMRDYQRKYIDLLEKMNDVRGNRNCG